MFAEGIQWLCKGVVEKQINRRVQCLQALCKALLHRALQFIPHGQAVGSSQTDSRLSKCDCK